MPYLQSLVIEAVSYDEEARRLRARYRGSGEVVVYEEVPPEVYDSLIFADSVSTFFREHIEGHFPAHRD